MSFTDIYDRLELTGKDGFISLASPDRCADVQLPERILRLIQDTSCPLSQLSALFCFGGKPLLFFFDNPLNDSLLHKAIWNLNEIPVVIVQKENTVDVYNGFAFEKELNSLKRLGDESILTDFSYFKMVTGQCWNEYQNQLASHNRVDYFLLKNIQYAQEKIQNSKVSRNLANRLIGKMIFLRYLADRHVMLDFEGRKQVLSNEDIIGLLQDRGRLSELFRILQDNEKGFNGDLFKITGEELEYIPDEALDVLVRLLRCDDLESGEYSLFDIYDFSILPVEFISNVYERFIGRENQEKKGAYYTPLFLVDYIVENTVAGHLRTSDDSSCKVLDPACGSGIFLVETLRRIIDHYKAHASSEDLEVERFQNKLKDLVLDNIYGIDSDESAVQVAAFSIYLTLLDYQNPADISDFRFPNLMSSNLICQDSFSQSPFEGVEFDYIIGNPPWKRGGKEYDETGMEIVPEYQRYIDVREQLEKRTIVNNKEIAQAFVVRTMDFMSQKTQCAFVLTSKILYNIQSHQFREFLLDKVLLDSVLELSPVRREVFSQSSDPAIAPACVLMYRMRTEDADVSTHLVQHKAVKYSAFFKLFKVLTVEKSDIQNVRQTLLRDCDYLWKILLYGTYLDFILISRLRELDSIEDVIERHGLIKGQGMICGKEEQRRYDVSEYYGRRKIDAKNLHQYYITPSDSLWNESKAQRKRRPELFQAPLLLVKKSTGSKDYTSRAAVVTTDAVYTDAITGVHSDDVDILRNMAGVLNSGFFSYYALMSMSSIATEREQAHNKEKFAIPYVDGGICRHVERIENYYDSLGVAPVLCAEDEQLERERLQIEKCIYQELHITEVEKAIIDYACTYSIPLSKGERNTSILRNTESDKAYIGEYANVFMERFRGQFGSGMYLNYECRISASCVMLRFIVEDIEKRPVFTGVPMADLDKLLLSLSSQKVSDNLYLRKDIRGFERDGFYVMKPVEKRLWHKAVAYVDVQEFADSMFE